MEVTEVDGEHQLHERLRSLLPSARAESCQVVATFLDIRAFSTFASRSESFDSAIYLRSVYSTMLANYFPQADFFKPTGDGLFLVHELPAEPEKVPPVMNSVLERCLALVDDFGLITAEDYMVNFDVPQRLGVGVARGSVTRLVSGQFVLDYTGRCLNLAARLMDKARPYGVVFADPHARRLMTPELSLRFTDDRVCLRGISEDEPIPICISTSVEIAPADREPLPRSENDWGEPTNLSIDEVRELSSYGFYLPRAPRSFEVACVHVEYPSFDKDSKRTGSVSWFTTRGEVEEQPGGTIVRMSMKRVHDSIKDLPASTTGRILGLTKKTYVRFTPYVGPAKGK